MLGFEFRQTMVHHIAQAVKPGEKSMATWLAWFGNGITRRPSFRMAPRLLRIGRVDAINSQSGLARARRISWCG